MYKKINTEFYLQENYNAHLKNTRGQSCSDNDMTVCCPHMSVNSKGEYMGTNEKTPFLYRGHTYELHTCCKVCAQQMQALGDNEFDRVHKPVNMLNYLLVHHKDTKVPIQKMKLIK